MKRLIALMIVGVLGAGSAYAQETPPGTESYDASERALESVTIRLFLRPDGSGSAVASECGQCAPLRLIVEPSMQVHVGGQQIQWGQSLSFGTELVDVFYDFESRSIARIVAP